MKSFIVILTGVLLTIGCTQSGSSEKNAAVAAQLFDAFNRHDWQEMTSFYAEDASFLDPSYSKEYVTKSRKETIEKYTEMEKMFPDIRDEVVATYPSGDVVTVEFVSTGKMNDSISFRLPIISVLTFKDGLIIKDATYYDLENP
jgi:ketosteroid isomerase-like protein